MAEYLKLFQTDAEYQAYMAGSPLLPNVSFCKDTSVVRSTPSSGPKANGHKYVDLGLPSGTLWATCNVGANAPEDPGNFYAFGETFGKNVYTEQSYTFNKTIDMLEPVDEYEHLLSLEDDAAHSMMGGDWHMPSKRQFEELRQYCNISSAATNGGITLFRVTSVSNGNSIIFPSTGYNKKGTNPMQESHTTGFNQYFSIQSCSCQLQSNKVCCYCFIGGNKNKKDNIVLSPREYYVGNTTRGVIGPYY